MSTVDPAGRSHSFLGVTVHALRMEEWHALIGRAIRTRDPVVVTSLNCHGIYVAHESGSPPPAPAGTLTRIDGMSVVWLGRLLGHPLERDHRLTWNDWMDPFMRLAEQQGWRIFYLGSSGPILDKGIAVLRSRHRDLEIDGHHGFFDANDGDGENDAVLSRIEAFEPDILMVGMGMPRQERWIAANRDRLDVPVILSCGAAIEYVAGAQAVAPRWMGRIGLEWLHRLWLRPRTMWRRYLVEPWSVAWLAIREMLS